MGRKSHAEKSADDGITLTADDATLETAAATDGLATAKPVESKPMKFKRLAQHRMPKALKSIAAVARLGARGQYEYSESQKKKIMDELSKAVIAVALAFEPSRSQADGWDLGD